MDKTRYPLWLIDKVETFKIFIPFYTFVRHKTVEKREKKAIFIRNML